MAHFRRPNADQKRRHWAINDTCYKAGRAAKMELKRRVPFVNVKREVEEYGA